MGINREQFMALPKLEPVEIEVPGWGTVRLKKMSALELIEFREFVRVRDWEQLSDSQKEVSGLVLMAKAACRCMVDDQGTRILQDEEYTELFGRENHEQALRIIFDELSEINGISMAAKAKNSEPSPSDDSVTD